MTKKENKIIICKVCSDDFVAQSGNAVYCSPECRIKTHKGMKKKFNKNYYRKMHPSIIIRPINGSECLVIARTISSEINQTFLIEDLPELIRDLTNEYL